MPKIESLLELGCAYCGACIAICPVSALSPRDDTPHLDKEKCTECQLCSKICPALNMTLIEEEKILEAYTAKTTLSDVEKVCQDGGVVTTLLIKALDEGIIEAAITCGVSETEPLKPLPLISTNKQDLLSSAGSKYSLSPILSLLKEAVSKFKSIAVVGLPCHIRAIYLIKSSGLVKYSEPIKFTIGLFCMNNYPYAKFIKALRDVVGVSPDVVEKIIIRKGKLAALCKDGSKHVVKVSKLKSYAGETCRRCPDFTAWFSDISVGSVGSEEGWTSVLIRTENGRKIFNMAVRDGMLVSKPLPESSLEAIRRLERVKRKRLQG